MLKNTFIARASDGLILCETYDSTAADVQVQHLKLNAKQLMSKLGPRQPGAPPSSCTVDTDGHCFQ